MSLHRRNFLHLAGAAAAAGIAAPNARAQAAYPTRPVRVIVPAGTPREIIDKLNREIARAVASPEVTQRLAVLGYTSVSSSPEECAAKFRAEAAKWTKVIRVSGMKGE